MMGEQVVGSVWGDEVASEEEAGPADDGAGSSCSDSGEVGGKRRREGCWKEDEVTEDEVAAGKKTRSQDTLRSAASRTTSTP
mmetsp:Transcript_38131/g.89878  ORF Transcript_38131/g.89878 Transcript_38131/m.89878 type:complete len:82 (+) Transcript_38131:829-1074(+)